MTFFKLPDLGEGLTEAEIREWYVLPGDVVNPDQPLLAVETEKAVVDIPSPQQGTLVACFGQAGDRVRVGEALVEFADSAQKEDGQAVSAGNANVPGEPGPQKPALTASEKRDATEADSGTVVGQLATTASHGAPQPFVIGSPSSADDSAVRATPAARRLAARQGIDLTGIQAPGRVIQVEDVEAALAGDAGGGQGLRGVARQMAEQMTLAHQQVAAVTLTEEVDISAWHGDRDITIRLIQSILAACEVEPGLNAWYDGQALSCRMQPSVNLGIAVDSPEGLIVPVLHDVGQYSVQALERVVSAAVQGAHERSLEPAQLQGATFTLSNFGSIFGRYATPVVIPPTVAILGAGRVREGVLAIDNQIAIHPLLPLSLSFDHRAVSGGQAARFLQALAADLATRQK